MRVDSIVGTSSSIKPPPTAVQYSTKAMRIYKGWKQFDDTKHVLVAVHAHSAKCFMASVAHRQHRRYMP
jgi:hypothetical protein